jgi:hypothetical protein
MQLLASFELDQVFDFAQRSLIGQDLPTLSLFAESCGKIGDVTHCAVIHTALEADVSQGCIAGGKADAQI